MEYIIISFVIISVAVIIKFALNIKIKDIKKLKELAFNKEEIKILSKLPESEDIAKSILKRLNNNHTKIKKSDNPEDTTSIYVVLTDNIIIANIKNTITYVQTIAHECIHSVQDKAVLWFNFIYTNLYNLFFIVLIILKLFNIINEMVWIAIFILTGVVYYIVRSYLENDAMIKARFLAKEYMQEKAISTREEIDKIVNKYDELNDIGIRCTNFQFLSNILVKIIILAVIFLIR